MLHVGADPFRTSNRTDVEAVYRATRESLTAPASGRAFYLSVAALFALPNDGHVEVALPEMIAHAKAGGAFFPLSFGIDDDGLWIRTGDARVPIGSRVVAIDGRTEAVLRSLALGSVGAQTPALLRRRAARQAVAVLYALDGPKASYDLTFRTPEGRTTTVTLAAAPPAVERAGGAPYTYTTIANGRVGYLDYRSCENRERFDAFLLDTFAAIALWGYVSDRPFKHFGGDGRRASVRLKREYGHDKYVDTYGEAAWSAADGTYLETIEPADAELVIPPPTPLRFDGKAVLLIGTGTFSSAMACAVAAKDYALATLVGEETGEPVVRLTTKVFFGPKPRPDRQGVVPDVTVVPTLDDLRSGRDVVLARGIAIARGL